MRRIYLDSTILELLATESGDRDASLDFLERSVIDQVTLVSSVVAMRQLASLFVDRGLSGEYSRFEQLILDLCREIYPLEPHDLSEAVAWLAENRSKSLDIALTVALLRRQGVEQILSFDTRFDQIIGVARIDPERL